MAHAGFVGAHAAVLRIPVHVLFVQITGLLVLVHAAVGFVVAVVVVVVVAAAVAIAGLVINVAAAVGIGVVINHAARKGGGAEK